MAAPKKKKPRRGAPDAGPAPEDMGDPTMEGGGDPMMVMEGSPPPMDMMPPGLEAVAGTGMGGAPMMEGGPMMAPSQFPSTDPGMMLAAMSRLMDADHEALSMQQMSALQAVGPMAAQAIARASGMAESVDVPGGPAGMMP
jgi:hypothetical protein